MNNALFVKTISNIHIVSFPAVFWGILQYPVVKGLAELDGIPSMDVFGASIDKIRGKTHRTSSGCADDLSN